MKKLLLPIVAIMVLGILATETSCKKKSSSSAGCVCTVPGGSTTGKDTSYTVVTTSAYSCSYYDSVVKLVTASGGCK